MPTQLMEIADRKTSARKHAFAARKAAQSQTANIAACGYLTEFINALPACTIVAGYMPIQTEIDPRATMNALHDGGVRICLPVIQGHGQPLLFREWTPGCGMIEGDFGALIPRGGEYLIPDVSIVPLVGFDQSGARLGYGGGFYDRTLALLRDAADFVSVGFAFAGQELDAVPTDKFDQRLHAIVTEDGVRQFS